MTRIAVDAMSGDSGPRTVVRALASLIKNHPDVDFQLVGDAEILRREIAHSRQTWCGSLAAPQLAQVERFVATR